MHDLNCDTTNSFASFFVFFLEIADKKTKDRNTRSKLPPHQGETLSFGEMQVKFCLFSPTVQTMHHINLTEARRQTDEEFVELIHLVGLSDAYITTIPYFLSLPDHITKSIRESSDKLSADFQIRKTIKNSKYD